MGHGFRFANLSHMSFAIAIDDLSPVIFRIHRSPDLTPAGFR
jgi:hypothetical protein